MSFTIPALRVPTVSRGPVPSRPAGIALKLDRVTRTFGDTTVLHELSMEVRTGEFVSILGPSGSGKSTTLNIIAGFDQATRGSVHLGDRDITDAPPYARGMGMVFQNYALFPHLSVFENVAFPLRSRGRQGEPIDRSVMRALDLVQMTSMASRFPRELSGGQQQRVALARAIVYGPDILLMDEPLGALDRRLRADMQVEIKRLHRELGTTLVYVTHDQDEALSMSDRIAILHQGRLEQFDAPRTIYWHPATKFAAGFVGETNFMHGVADVSGTSVWLDELGSAVAIAGTETLPSGQVTVSIRPENILLSRAGEGDAVEGTIEEVLFLGDAVKCIVRVGGLRLTVKQRSGGDVDPRVTDRVGVRIEPATYPVFPRAPEDGR
jgi:putative spermidine/putrescine transport system ATP-binding protein